MADHAESLHHSAAYRRGLVFVLSAGVCWSMIGIVLRLIEAAEAWQILFYRSLTLWVFLSLVILLRSGGRPLAVFRRAGLSAVLGGLALVFAFSGSVFSILNTTVANAVFIFATAPFFAALLGRLLLGEPVRRATWIAIAVGAVGVALMVGEGLRLGHLLGNVAALVSALGFAFFALALRWGRSDDMFPAACLGGFFTTLVAGIACLVTGIGFVVPLADLGLAATLGVFQLGVGMMLFTVGSRSVPAGELTLLAMTEVLLAPIWVWLFLGETAGPWTLIGGAVLLSAIFGNAVTGLRRQPPPIAP